MAESRKELIKCIQVNLQHSKAATDNLMHIIATENIDITQVKKISIYQEEIKGVSRKYTKYSHGQGR